MKRNIFPSPAQQLTPQKSIPYQQLAIIYNQVMRHVNYPQWARYITAVIHKQGVPGKHFLDIGCGTGEFIFQMGKLGFQVDGCDPSPSMLKIAQSKNPTNKFWLDQLPELHHTPAQHYAAITCLYDTINYLESISILQQAIQRVYELLLPEGLFIFDVVSEEFCKNYFHEVNDKEVINSKYAYVRKSYYRQPQSEQVNHFTIYTPEGIFEETHIQKIFPFPVIQQVISQHTAFEILEIYDDFTFFPMNTNSDRAHFILKKVIRV